MTACEYIDRILLERNLSRRQLAKMANIAPSTLQSAMSRNGFLSLDLLLPIVEALGISITDKEALNMLSDEQHKLMLAAWHSGWSDRSETEQFSVKEEVLLTDFRRLNDKGQELAIDYVQLLAENEKYLK